MATVKVGAGSVVVAILTNNITVVQFNTERSAAAGQAFLKNFLLM